MRWAGHVARIGRTDVLRRFWLRNMSIRDQLKDLGVNGRKILNGIFKNQKGSWTGLMLNRIAASGGFLTKQQ
jgi:hypothetical protein